MGQATLKSFDTKTVDDYIQCNPDIRELSGPENKSLISGVWSILFS